MKFRRIDLTRHLAFPTATSKLVDALIGVEGSETPNGIEIGAVLVPWHMVVLREAEPELPRGVPVIEPADLAKPSPRRGRPPKGL